MQGYIHDAAATAACLDADRYFNTGDLVRLNPATGDLVITGVSLFISFIFFCLLLGNVFHYCACCDR